MILNELSDLVDLCFFEGAKIENSCDITNRNIKKG